jgi:crotonobetainyl-CoA:carnitine CoA-transferase CaiB-like acyl-CoA transferase
VAGEGPVLRRTDGTVIRALEGVRVLDLTRVLAGPLGTMILGDLGADVIKVERPGVGDDLRAWGPPWTDDGEAAYFIAVNRNKRSLTLDLKDPRGRDVFLRLAATADVVVDNFRPGTMDDLGLDDAVLSRANPRLVRCSLTAFGTAGPYRDLPAYDIILQAMGGLMSVTGEPEGRPMRVGAALVDVLGGLYVAIGIMAALRVRDRGGEAPRVDLSLLGVELASLVNIVQNWFVTGQPARRLGNAHPSMVPYDIVPTRDGWLALAVATEDQWRRFCGAISRPDLAVDERFLTNRLRVANREPLMAELGAILRLDDTHAWVDTFRGADVPCGPVNSIDAILSDPQVLAEGLIQEMARPDASSVRVLAGPLRIDGERPAVGAAPRLGADTADVLREIGLGPDVIAALRRDGVA